MEERCLDGNPLTYSTNHHRYAPCLVMLHPAFGDGNFFAEQIKVLQPDYKLIVPDLLGHGASQTPGKIVDTTKWLLEILAAEGVTSVHLLGISLGGLLAQDFANHHPDRTTSLFCVGAYDINHYSMEVQKDVGSTQMKMFLKVIFNKKAFAKDLMATSAVTPEAQDLVYRSCLEFPKRSFSYLSSLNGIFNKFETEQRPYPLGIAVGSEDAPGAVKEAQAWHQREPASEFYIIEGAGHLANLDRPEFFNQILLDFFSRASSFK